MPVLQSPGVKVLLDAVGPNGEIGIRRRPFPWEFVYIPAAGIIIIVLIVLAVKYLIRIRNYKAKDD
jgi:hypothetical protein